MTLNVTEHFYSLEGESVNLGVPTYFVRLARCNLRCTWCDSKYTWEPGEEIPILRLHEAIQRTLKPYSLRHVNITGGEPMLQQDPLARFLPLFNGTYKISIETAATLMPRKELQQRVDTWNVSVKLSHSGNPEKARLKPDVISHFASQRNAYFKFVIDTMDDTTEMEALIEQYQIPNHHVVIMPQAITVKEMQEREFLADYCKDKGFRYSPRLHVLLWGDKRGV